MDERKKLPTLPKGMGTYSYDTSGKIRFRKVLCIKESTIRVSVSGSSVAEVNRLMAAKEKEFLKKVRIESGIAVRPLQDSILDWLTLYKKNDVSPRTYDRIKSTYDSQIVDSFLGKMQEPSITSDDIQLFLNELKNKRTGKPLTYSSKKKVYELLSQYFRHKFINDPYDDPMRLVKKPKKDVEDIDDDIIVYDDDEIRAFITEASKTFINGVGGYKYGLLYVFMIWTCVRIGEARGIQWKDIDLNKKELRIYKAMSPIKDHDTGKVEQKVTKTKNRKNRVVPLTQPALDAIIKFKKICNPSSDDEYIFKSPSNPLKPITNTTIERTYYNIVKKAGLDYKHVTVHGLRHTGCSAMIRHGVPIEVVSRIAGHSSIQITLDIYTQVIEAQKRQAMDDFKF